MAGARRRPDHVRCDRPCSLHRRAEAERLEDVHFGLPGIDTTLSVLLAGAHHGRISYERLVEVYAMEPARLYGLWPDKGRLEVGADADLVLADPNERWHVRDEDIVSKAGWPPFAGRTLHGPAVKPYLRGEPAVEEGRVVAEPGHGRFLRRADADAGRTARS